MHSSTLLRFAAGLSLWLSAAVLSAQPLIVNQVSPNTGSPGDSIQVAGQGFTKPAQAYVAWGFSGNRGFVLEIDGKQGNTSLNSTLGPLRGSVQGPVTLWQGKRRNVAPTNLGGPFKLTKGHVLTPEKAAQGPGFQATGSVGLSSKLVNGQIRIAFNNPNWRSATPPEEEPTDDETEEASPTERKPPEHYAIEVIGVGGSCGEPDGDGDGINEKWGFEIRIECKDGPCRGRPLNAISSAINHALSANGVSSNVQGNAVVVSHPGGLCKSFINLQAHPLP